MGDIADMMIDGTLCECCGCFIDDDIPGFPRYCSKECADNRRGPLMPKTNKGKTKSRIQTKLKSHKGKQKCQ